MVERGSTHHSGRVDDELARETASLTRGAPVEARAEEERFMEPPADGEPQPDALVREASAPPGGPDHDALEERSALAASLRPSAFPARRDALLAVAREEGAPPNLLAVLARLPADRVYGNVGEVWQAAGGTVERRPRPEPAPVPPRPEQPRAPERPAPVPGAPAGEAPWPWRAAGLAVGAASGVLGAALRTARRVAQTTAGVFGAFLPRR